MAEWSRNKANSANINGGKEFTSDDDLSVAELNAMVNNSFYGVDFVEAMASEPDISEIAGDGTPSVSLADNGKFKRFKFSNLKGSKGDTGEKGDKGDKGDTGDTVPNTLTIGTVEGGETASATITGTAPNQFLNLVLPKGDKGDTGAGGLSLIHETGFTERTGLASRLDELYAEGIIPNIIINKNENIKTSDGWYFRINSDNTIKTGTATEFFTYANKPAKFYGTGKVLDPSRYTFTNGETVLTVGGDILTLTKYRFTGGGTTMLRVEGGFSDYSMGGSLILPYCTLEYYK